MATLLEITFPAHPSAQIQHAHTPMAGNQLAQRHVYRDLLRVHPTHDGPRVDQSLAARERKLLTIKSGENRP